MLSAEGYALLSLFMSCFLAATILPFSSEIILTGFLLSGNYSPMVLILIATLGNSLGGCTNYLLGYFGNRLWREKFGKKQQQQKVTVWVETYGYWSALLAWLPFVGDPLMIALGFYKTRIIPTFILMTLGKLGRYVVIAAFLV